jgi:hypothetical protein
MKVRSVTAFGMMFGRSGSKEPRTEHMNIAPNRTEPNRTYEHACNAIT